MSDTPYCNQAETAARFEKYYNELCKLDAPRKLDNISGLESLSGYQLLESVSCADSPGEQRKALIFLGPNKELYIHYRGTGDGNWDYNTAVFSDNLNGDGLNRSPMQEWAVQTYENALEKYSGKFNKLYVTGHSQGGHNAQYVTLHAEHADQITACVSLDGPGHSTASIEEAKAFWGGDNYERQRHKIYAYNGVSDFVSCLGQEQIVPEDHTFYVDTRTAISGIDPEDADFVTYHSARYLLDENDGFNTVYLASDNPETPFRQLVKELNARIKELNQEQQELVASVIMQICENVVGSDEPYKVNINEAQFQELKEILVPMLVDVLAEKPELLEQVLEQFNLDALIAPDASGTDAPIKTLIMDLIHELNDLPPTMRTAALEYLAKHLTLEDLYIYDANGDLIEVVPNGKIGFDKDGLLSDLPEGLVKVVPIILDTIRNHPDDVLNVLKELNVGQMVVDFIKEHPIQAIAIALIAPLAVRLFGPLIATYIVVSEYLIDAIKKGYAILQRVSEIVGRAVNCVLHCLQHIHKALTKFAKWLHQTFNAGAKYVRNNPFFKADTDRLRGYATRIGNVNRRLRILDGDLRGLYWQVGFLDLWDILVANLLTSESPTLRKVETYLNNAAQTLEDADRRARALF